MAWRRRTDDGASAAAHILSRAADGLAESVTLVRLGNWIGDVVMALPALRLLADNGHRLQLVGKRWAADLLQGTGWEVHAYPSGWRERTLLLRELAAQGRTAQALCLPNSLSSALAFRLAGVPAVGYRNEGRALLLARSLPLPRVSMHEVQRHWLLACQLLDRATPLPNRIELPVSPAHQHSASRLLAQAGVRPGFIAVAPFAASGFAGRDKCWPHFPAFLQVAAKFGRDIVVCPGPGDEQAQARALPGVIVLDGLGLGAYLALLGRAALVLSNDTGPGHMAAATGVPVLSLFGPSDPRIFGPWGPNVSWMHDPNWPSVDAVLQRAQSLLEQA